MKLRSKFWRMWRVPVLVLFSTSQMVMGAGFEGVGVVVRPLSPFDPAQPFMAYVPGDTLNRLTTLDNLSPDGALKPLQQLIIPQERELGFFPHMPSVPEAPEQGKIRLRDFNVRWAKSFHSGMVGGDFYVGFKKKLMEELHRNHVDILRAIRELTTIAQANPDRYYAGFGRFDDAGVFQADSRLGSDVQRLLEGVLNKVYGSHKILSSILVLPPASIDPDLMLNWLDSVNVGPRYSFGQNNFGARVDRPLVARQAQVHDQIQNYCSAKYLPWVITQNARRHILDRSDVQELALTTDIINAKIRRGEPFLLPSHTQVRQVETQAPSLELGGLQVVRRDFPGLGGQQYVVMGEDHRIEDGGTRLFRLLSSSQVGLITEETTLRNGIKLKDWLESKPYTKLAYEILAAQLQKLALITRQVSRAGEQGVPAITADDIEALIKFYVKEKSYAGRDYFDVRDFNTALNTFFHIPVRSHLADLSQLENVAFIREALSGRGAEPPQESEEHYKRTWIARSLEQASYYLCQSAYYQRFYENFLLGPKTKEDSGHTQATARVMPPTGDVLGASFEANITSAPVFDAFSLQTEANRISDAWEAGAQLFDAFSIFPMMRNWGYFYDILVTYGRVPRETGAANMPFTLGSSLDNHQRYFMPGLIRSPYLMWLDIQEFLIHMPVDLSSLPEFRSPGSKESGWVFQDGGYKNYEDLLQVSEAGAANFLNTQERLSALESVKEVSLYLFRNRVSFTPQEQYLFLMAYFKDYLLPLAYLFQSFSTRVFDDSRLSQLTAFEVPKGALSSELIHMLNGSWTEPKGSGNQFIARKIRSDDNWQFSVDPQGKNLVISFLDPMLRVFAKHVPVEDATTYGKLAVQMAKINRYIDQRVRWCAATPRHTIPMPDNIDQYVDTQVTQAAHEQAGEEGSSSEQTPRAAQRLRARAQSRSPYLYPKAGEREKFPIPGVLSDENNLQERDLWLNLLCSFPVFIRHYFEGYVDLAQQYQKAMAIFRYVELFQRKRNLDVAHLPYLEGLPERTVFQRDYAFADSRDRQDGKLNRTIYAREVDRYMRMKQAYVASFDNVQSMLDGVFKLDYSATDYVHALEEVYLGATEVQIGGRSASLGAYIYDALAAAYAADNGHRLPENAQEMEMKNTGDWWINHGRPVINGVVTGHLKPGSFQDPRQKLVSYDFTCQDDQELTELHLIYQNSLVCSLQRQVVHKIMLQRTLVEYRKAMDEFFKVATLSSDADPFAQVITWAAKIFEQMLTEENMGKLGEQLESLTRPQQAGEQPANPFAAMIPPDMAMGAGGGQPQAGMASSQDSPPPLTWEDAIGEVDRVKIDIVGSFLREIIGVIKYSRPEGATEQDVMSYYASLLKTYREGVKLSFGEPIAIEGIPSQFLGHSVNNMRAVYWFFGPNVLFENPNYSPTPEHYAQVAQYFDDYYRMIPLAGEESLPGMAFEEGSVSREDRRAMIELLRLFDHQIFKYTLNNIVNAKLLLGEEKLTPVSQTLFEEVGALGSDEVIRERMMGTAEVYGQVAPFEFTLFIFNRQSPVLQKWRQFVSNVTILDWLTPDIGLSTRVGDRYELEPYGSEDWLSLNKISGSIGRALGVSQEDPSMHLWMHKQFCKWGAALRGGSLVQDVVHARTFQWEWIPDFGNVDWFWGRDEPPPETNISREVEQSQNLSTRDFVEYREAYESWYCDVFSANTQEAPVREFTLREMNTLNRADQRISIAKQKMNSESDEDEEFQKGAEDLKILQGSKMYESALLWSFLELLNTYVMEPYMKSGFVLQELFGELDVTQRAHLGYFVNETEQTTLPFVPTWLVPTEYVPNVQVVARAENFFNRLFELKGTQALQSIVNDGLLMNFADTLTGVKEFDPHAGGGLVEASRSYRKLLRDMLKVFHIYYDDQLPVSSNYVVVGGKVDVPGELVGGDTVLKFLSGGEDERFQDTALFQRLSGGNTLPESQKAEQRCIDEVSLTREALLGSAGLLTEDAFNTLSPQDRQTYLANVRMANALSQYADYLEYEDDAHTYVRPGFCFLKKLMFNTAYQLLLGKREVEAEAISHSADEKACQALSESYAKNLKWNVGSKNVRALKTALAQNESVNNDYCHHILYSFKVADVFRRITGYGSDMPEREDTQRTAGQPEPPSRQPELPIRHPERSEGSRQARRDPSPPAQDDVGGAQDDGGASQAGSGMDNPAVRQKQAALNMMVVFQNNMDDMEQWRMSLVQSIALNYPQLDQQIAIAGGATTGGWGAGQDQQHPFIKRAFIEIVKKHGPYGGEGLRPLEELTRHFTQHPGPLCEFFNAKILSSSSSGGVQSQDAYMDNPQMKQLLSAQLEGNDYILGSNLCPTLDGLSAFSYTRQAHENNSLEATRERYAAKVKKRYKTMADKITTAFPWMSGVQVAQGQQDANLHLWLTYYAGEGPSTALFEYVTEHAGAGVSKGVETFIEDQDEKLGYTGILTKTITDNISAIKQQYHASNFAVLNTGDFDLTRLSELETAKLFQLLAQRFSMPHLYDSIREEVGPRYDKFYHFFVPVHVWNQYKQFEQYQSVAGTVSGTIFVVQMLISFNPMMNLFRPLMGGFIRAGTRTLGRVAGRLGAHIGAVAGFALVTALALVASSTVGAYLAYNVFKIFGADWRPIQIGFFGATLLGSLFIGLSRIQFMNRFFKMVTPSLHLIFQLGWYFFIMDVVMYFGDKVTWDYASREYGYFKALYETYATRRGMHFNEGSSIKAMFDQEARILESVPADHGRAVPEGGAGLYARAPVEHVPIFSEYQYVKHLQKTSTIALSYLWFGIGMAGAMDYAQLRTVHRFKGINVIPYRGTSHWVPAHLRGVAGTLDDAAFRFREQLGDLASARDSATAAARAAGNLGEYASQRYSDSPVPESMPFGPEIVDSVRLSRAVTDVLRSAAMTSGTWEDGARNAQDVMRVALAHPTIDGLIRSAKGEGYDTFHAQLMREISRMDGVRLTELTQDPVRLGTPATDPALTEVFNILRQEGQGSLLLRELSAGIVRKIEDGKINAERFARELSFHHAKWDAIFTHMEEFRSYRQGFVSQRRALVQRLGREPTDTELRNFVTEHVMVTMDWTRVDNEMEFQIIRYVVWNNSVVHFLRHHGFFWVKRAAGVAVFPFIHPIRFVGLSAQLGRMGYRGLSQQTARLTDYLSTGLRTLSNQYFGEPLELDYEGTMDATVGREIARVVALKKIQNLDEYIAGLRDLMPLAIESVRGQQENLNIPLYMREDIAMVIRDYDALRQAAGMSEDVGGDEGIPAGKLGNLIRAQRTDTEDIEAVRDFLDLEAMGLFRVTQGDSVGGPLVSELSVDSVLQNMKPYTLTTLLSRTQDFAAARGLDATAYRDALLRAVGEDARQDIPETLTRHSVAEIFARGGDAQLAYLTRAFIRELMVKTVKSQSDPLNQYEALLRFKRDFLFESNAIQSGSLLREMKPVRLLSHEDLDAIAIASKDSTLVSRLERGEKAFASAVTSRQGVASGGTYVMVTPHKDQVDAFYDNINAKAAGWQQSFGLTGPYMFMKAEGMTLTRQLGEEALGYWTKYQPPALSSQTLLDDWARDLKQEEENR